MTTSTTRVAVIGGGVIGWSCAWQAARQGHQVTVFDPTPGGGASGVAAGMIAPASELHHGEEPLLGLGLKAAAEYPDFIAAITDDSGLETGFQPCGTLAVALDAGDRDALYRIADLQETAGVNVARLTGREARRLEPFLAPAVTAALHLPDDHQVDNRRLLRSLQVAAAARGVTQVARRAGIVVQQDSWGARRVTSVRRDDGDLMPVDQVVLATGSYGGQVPGVPADVMPPIRPVKGQILRVRVPEPLRPLLSRTIRGTVHGFSVYLVPRRDGEVVVGATSEELGPDETVTVGGVFGLLRDAQDLLPGISEAQLLESAARLRPGTPDNAPVVGPTAVEGLLLALGHYRGGVMMAGITGEAIAALLRDPDATTAFADYSPARFTAAPAAASTTSTASIPGTEPLEQETH